MPRAVPRHLQNSRYLTEPGSYKKFSANVDAASWSMSQHDSYSPPELRRSLTSATLGVRAPDGECLDMSTIFINSSDVGPSAKSNSLASATCFGAFKRQSYASNSADAR